MEKAAQLGMLNAMWANRKVSLANKVTEKLEGHFFGVGIRMLLILTCNWSHHWHYERSKKHVDIAW